MAGGVFHVEFGFNDTPLTRALESGNYMLAEKLICETANPSSLDEGCYQRTPLYICLCGLDAEETRPRPRNLYIARLLIERGANVNYRVPTTYFGCEYSGPGKTALELLVDFYIELTTIGHPGNHDMRPCYHNVWDPQVDTVVGINKQYLSMLEDVIEHVEDLVFLILGAGGDANIPDEMRKSPLHRLSILSHDVRLFKLLCESGANVNSLDCRGNSPLISLCDLSATEMYDYMEDLSPCSNDTLEDTSASLSIKRDFLNYLLRQKNIRINIQNSTGHTALFHCIVRGDVQAAQTLLIKGADPSIKGTVWETRKRKRRISPIFVTFLSIPVQRSINWQNMYTSVATAPRQYSHLVDAGYFSRKEITDELRGMLHGEFSEFSHLSNISDNLVNLMFGQASATLKQLAARSIFHQCFIKHRRCISKLLPVDVIKETVENTRELHPYEDYISFILNTTVLQTLVKHLGLPRDFLVNFEVELLLHRLAHKMSSMKAMPPENIFCDSDGSLSDLSESESTGYSEEGGDSDLEYW
ncbi:hypothetical protein ACF0H5_007408 [Mactra antiquata]